jgi:hypothetical protein
MKIDTTKIEGYSEMSAEDKLKALEEFDMPDPDYSGYVKKDLYDKAASELAAKKKELKDKLTEDEQKALDIQQKQEELQSNYDKLLRESNISKATAKFLALGYDDKLAAETAEAYVDGDTDKVFANQQKAQVAFEKKVRAEALKDTPKPTPDGGDKAMTLDKFRKLSPQERYDFSVKNPEEYKALYNGGTE